MPSWLLMNLVLGALVFGFLPMLKKRTSQGPGVFWMCCTVLQN